MSDANQEARGWRLYVQDMIGFSEKVLSYTGGLDQAAFVADERTYGYATLRNLELVGEAATHIPEAVRDAHPMRLSGARSLQRETAWPTTGYLGMDG